MNLIDTYLSEVGKDLPRKTRADIETEIRSTLQDMLDERAAETGKPVDDELILEVLKDYGPPEKVAASYQGERYLIGPRLYPLFLNVLRIVLIVFVVLALIGLGTQLVQAGLSSEKILEEISSVFGAFITALGNVVLIFAIIEWAIRQEGIQLKGPRKKEWDPRSLRKISPPDQAKVGERIANILLDFAAVAAFNFYPQWIGINTLHNGTWTHFPIFSAGFFHFVPWLTLIWTLDIVLNILVLRQGQWRLRTRLCDVALRAGVIATMAVLLTVPGLLNITAETITASTPLMSIENIGQIVMTARQGFISTVVIVILFECLEVGKHIYRMITGTRK